MKLVVSFKWRQRFPIGALIDFLGYRWSRMNLIVSVWCRYLWWCRSTHVTRCRSSPSNVSQIVCLQLIGITIRNKVKKLGREIWIRLLHTGSVISSEPIISSMLSTCVWDVALSDFSGDSMLIPWSISEIEPGRFHSSWNRKTLIHDINSFISSILYSPLFLQAVGIDFLLFRSENQHNSEQQFLPLHSVMPWVFEFFLF